MYVTATPFAVGLRKITRYSQYFPCPCRNPKRGLPQITQSRKGTVLSNILGVSDDVFFIVSSECKGQNEFNLTALQRNGLHMFSLPIVTIVVNDLGARKSIPLYSVDGWLMIQFRPSVQIGDSIYRL